MVWYLERTLTFTCHLQNGSAFAFLHLLNTLNILLLNVTGLNSAVKRTCVLEHLHRKSISGALICNTASSGTFLHVFWECPVVMDLWTHVNLVLSSLRTDCFANTSVCLLDDDSGLFISLIQRRRLFAGFAAARRTMMQNWCVPHVYGEAYWIAYYYYFISIFFLTYVII